MSDLKDLILNTTLVGKDTFDVGNLCVWCKNDTSFGSGKFVNRIPVFADTESTAFANELSGYEYIEGYGCEECYEDED